MDECRMNPERLSALVDGELRETDRRTVEAHVAACERCRSEVVAMRAVRDEVASLPYEPVAPAEWERVWSGVARALRRPMATRRRRRASVLVRLWGRPRPALAAAALALAMVGAGLLALSLRAGHTPVAPNGIVIAEQGDVRLESIAYDCDDYTLVVMAPEDGGAPILWLTPTQER